MRAIGWVVLAVAAVCLSGCATKPRPAPMTFAEIIELSKQGLPAGEIIKRIEERATVYRLGASDVVMLREAGVPDEVINYMLETYTRAAVEAERRRADYYWGYPYPYYGPYWSWWWYRSPRRPR